MLILGSFLAQLWGYFALDVVFSPNDIIQLPKLMVFLGGYLLGSYIIITRKFYVEFTSVIMYIAIILVAFSVIQRMDVPGLTSQIAKIYHQDYSEVVIRSTGSVGNPNSFGVVVSLLFSYSLAPLLILKKVKYVVLDADAITCFKNDLKSFYSLLDKNKIITPHMGEFHTVFPDVKKELSNLDKALIAAKLIKSNIILKGANTIIVSHDKKIVINIHASPELAVIGSGDVLSGLVVSLIGEKKMNPFSAGCAATWLHGDIAKKFEKGLIAEDIVRGIPGALKRLKNGNTIK